MFLVTDLLAHLADRFEERKALDIANGSADFRDDNIRFLLLRQPNNALLDLVGDVRNNLDGGAKIVARAVRPAITLLINLSGGDRRAARAVNIHEPLVMAKIQVGLGAVFGHKDFPMLIRVHGARVHIDIGVELHGRDRITPISKQPSEARGRYSFPNGTHDAARNKDVLSQPLLLRTKHAAAQHEMPHEFAGVL